MVVRTDRGPLRKPQRAGAALVIEGHAARVHRPGDPLRYAHGHEYRDAQELKRIADQLVGKPVTLGHPSGLIRDGAKAQVVGRIDAAWVDGEHVAVRMTINDAQAAREIESGARELSLGYATRVDSDGYQRGTEVDHCAIVQAARCGSTCALRVDDVRLDCSKTCACSAQIDRSGQGGESGSMKTLEEAVARIDELEAEKKQFLAQIETLRGDIALGAQAAESEAVKELKTKLDTAEAQIKRFDEVRADEARARAKLERIAERHMGSSFRMDDLSDRAITEAVVKRLDGQLDVKALNDAELRGHFNALVSLADRSEESKSRVSEILGNAKEAPRADEESYESMMRNAWKKSTNSRQGAAGGR